MLGKESRLLRQYGRTKPIKVPSIATICEKASRNSNTVVEIKDKRSWHVLHIAKPKSVSLDIAQSLVQELMERKISNLQTTWREAGLIVPDHGFDAVDLNALQERWVA